MSLNLAPRGCATPTAAIAGLAFCAFVAVLVLGAVNGIWSTMLGGDGPVRPGPSAAPAGPGGAAQPGSSAGPGIGASLAPGADSNGVPPISERFFASGSTRATATGGFAAQADLPIDRVRSYVEREGMAWIAFGDAGPESGGPEVLVTFNEPEDTVTVAQGSRFAKGVDDQCRFDVQVTASLVSGHIACPNATVYDSTGAATGSAAIDVTFTAGS